MFTIRLDEYKVTVVNCNWDGSIRSHTYKVKFGESFTATSMRTEEGGKGHCNGATCSVRSAKIEVTPSEEYEVSVDNIQSDVFVSFGYGNYPPMRP